MAETKKKSTPKKAVAAKKVVKSVETKKVSTPKTTTTKKAKSNSSVTSVILGLIIVQFIVILFLGISVSTQSDELSQITEKVTRIDSFFASNAPGYGDGTTAPSAQAPSAAAPATKVELSQLNIEGEPTLGNADAPVTIVEYSDYECPFCGKFFSESYSQLKEQYIDTGLVKLVFKDFPLGFHNLAVPASAAANCVQSQLGDAKYFEMHDKIFSTQSSLSVANLKVWALEIGVEESEFTSCIESEEILSEINEDLAEGSRHGVSGTPSFFINGNLIVGAQPFSVLAQMIESELNN
ncbi:MAG: DsbA family protein [Nanoarchaeales archaeon]|nr:DsbA family protein [Nanoarchaeales archaeon]